VPTISVFYGIVIAMWTELHRDELEEDWRLAQELQPLRPIEPLP